MLKPVSLSDCRNLTELSNFLQDAPKPIVGKHGGRKVVLHNKEYSVNQLTYAFYRLEKDATFPEVKWQILKKLKQLDSDRTFFEKIHKSTCRKMTLILRRFFGHLFDKLKYGCSFNRKRILKQYVPPHDTTPASKEKMVGQFHTYLSLRKFVLGVQFFTTNEASWGVNKIANDILLDRQYSQRTDVAFFDKNGDVFLKPDHTPISFSYTRCCELKGEDFNSQRIKTILKKYAEANEASPIPKLFFPMAAFPTKGVPHALLLVIEVDSDEKTKAKISLVNSFGSQGGAYKVFEQRILEAAQEVFNSPLTVIIKNEVKQQLDGFSCGWHMIENIEWLSQVVDAGEAIRQRKLPVRSSQAIKDLYNNRYTPCIDQAREEFNNKVPRDDRLKTIDQLVAKGECEVVGQLC